MSTVPPNLEDCFKQGLRARAKGRTVADNPYGLDTPAWEEWDAGWRATCDLDEEDDPASDRLHEEDEVPVPPVTLPQT